MNFSQVRMLCVFEAAGVTLQIRSGKCMTVMHTLDCV